MRGRKLAAGPFRFRCKEEAVDDVITQKELAELQAVKDQLWELSNRKCALEGGFVRRLQAGASFQPGGPYEVSVTDGELRVVIYSS